MAATTMMTINHVLDCENELNDNLYNLKMCSGKNKNSPMRKLLKPLMKLIKKRTHACKKLLAKKNEKNQQQQQLDVFTEEVDNQNNSNEALEQRLLSDLTKADEGAAIITIGQDGKMTVVPVSCYVPVHFLPTLAGDFFWTTLPQQPVSDFYYKETIISQHQHIELQVI